MMKSLYIFRPLLNGSEIRAWMKSAGFGSSLPAPDMHTTVMYSKQPVEWSNITPDVMPITVAASPQREIERFDGGATVLQFQCNQLQKRWQALKNAGCSYDYPTFKPHITLSYQSDVATSDVSPYVGPLQFGGEMWKEITGSYEPSPETVLKSAQAKLDGVPLLSADELQSRGESRTATNDVFNPPFAAAAFHLGARRMLPEDVVDIAFRSLGGRT